MTDVLVTGAAGGLGSALVDVLVGRGDRVVAIDRAPSERHDVVAYALDLADERAVEDALSDAVRRGFELRHVVAIAGGALPEEKTGADLADLPLDVFRASLELNLVTAWITLRAALGHLRRAGGDRSITLTTSTDALASYGLPAYAAAKAGLIGLVHSLAGPLAADGIRINAVAPGDVPTPRNVREWAHVPDWYDRLREGAPLGRLGTPEDVAAAYLALIDMRHVTGQVIVVDGGQTISRPPAV
ncbi:MAG TPA: SDR family oxidoreductase [Gaiellales bacterium]|nr:SDR family oxidoreductase [Gaiellales bacterium]